MKIEKYKEGEFRRLDKGCILLTNKGNPYYFCLYLYLKGGESLLRMRHDGIKLSMCDNDHGFCRVESGSRIKLDEQIYVISEEKEHER